MGEIVAASGDAEVLTGTSAEKMKEMKTVFFSSRNVDMISMQITNGMTYGTIDRLKDFNKLEQEGTVEYVEVPPKSCTT